MRSSWWRWHGLAVGCGLGLAAILATRAGEPATVNVILWFDTEDYLLPADDDATLRLARLLTERGVRATFKLVGEKARVLERRGRRDVIEALQRHAIGYHTDFHSVHPTPTEYLADCGLLDGVAEFVRREAAGAADVRRILSVPTLACYGQPGSSWAPQAILALKPVGVAPQGVPCYVDDGDHVALDGQPFWYAGALTVYGMGPNVTRMDLHDAQAVEPAKRKVAAIAERLRGQGGGLISIYYHPCEWVHREFWDGVNFRRGANPPREQWKLPTQRSQDETDGAFARFGEYVDHIRALPGIRFVTASDLPAIYPDGLRQAGATAEDIRQLAAALAAPGVRGVDIQRRGALTFSVADQFELLAAALNELLDGRALPPTLPCRGLVGPDGPPPASLSAGLVAWPAFRAAALDAVDFIRSTGRVPARVFLGPDPAPPADFLTGLAYAVDYHARFARLPVAEGVVMGGNVAVLPARHIAEDKPGLFGGWIIHKEGFRAPKLMEIARLQAWTLKPAVR